MEFRKLIKMTTFNVILNKYLRFLSKAQKKKKERRLKQYEAVTTAPMCYRAASEYGTGKNWLAEKK